MEGFGSSGSAGSSRSIELLPDIPQREAWGKITLRRKVGKGVSLGKIPRDRPNPMEAQPPQDEDPNSSTLNPMSFPFPLPAAFCAKGSFLQKWGWTRMKFALTLLAKDYNI
jgi:hypothetical protein